MKIWEVLKKENIGKKYKTTIYSIEEILTVGYDENSNTFLTLKRYKHNNGVEFPLSQIYLGCILEKDFEEVE
ncbi:hypothetical protein N496_18800 (plasmid) [Clostridium botulinum A2B3 87]|uniref:hypothetical protein n=1 Tax=Clostridium botulinum TaxID=1491 RepID=UPI0004A58DBF|nr:hypothetical protein [Clostridium botulinum]KEI95015.1 hypothetical protein N496_18800 [Clostridium botulinum A2B3 87]